MNQAPFPWRNAISSLKNPSEYSPQEIGQVRERYIHWLTGGSQRFAAHPWILRAETAAASLIQYGWKQAPRFGVPMDRSSSEWPIVPITGERFKIVSSPPELTSGRGPNSFHDVSYNALFPLAWDYRRSGRREACDAALSLIRLLSDNGFLAGSEKGRGFLGNLTIAAYAHSVSLLKPELQEAGLLDQCVDTVLWYSEFEKACSQPLPLQYQETNADSLRCSVFNCLSAILSMEVGVEQSQLLNLWRNWLESALEVSPRFAGVFKPDGIGWHHSGVYTSAYAPHAFSFITLAAYLLHGTSLELRPELLSIVREALMTHRLISQKYDPPAATRGRISCPCPIVEAYAYFGLATEGKDREILGICRELLRDLETHLPNELQLDLDGREGKFLFSHTAGRLELLLEADQSGVEPVAQADGFWSKPWAALAIHRRDHWLASVKGWSQYVWDFEMHPKQWAAQEENVFGRYASHGTLQIISRGSQAASGWDFEAGWDWSHWPGTTTPHRSPQDLYDPATSWACRFFSGASFAGAVSAGGENGIFAFRIRDFFYDPGLHALKSYFFFGNEIICLGSNIESQDPTHPVHTTLFQCALGAGAEPLLLNGSCISHSEFTWSGKSGESVSLTDPVGNGYYLSDGAGVHLRIGQQMSRSANNSTSTKGNFATCWIDHGYLPKDLGADEASYHYVVIPNQAPETCQRADMPPSYTVLRRDHRAHLVNHHSSRSAGGAIFETDWIIPEGPVARTDTPILYMIQEEPGGLLRLSIADPDLRLPKRRNIMFLDDEARRTKARPREVEIFLRGHWKSVSTKSTLHLHSFAGMESLTSIKVICSEGLTRELLLSPA